MHIFIFIDKGTHEIEVVQVTDKSLSPLTEGKVSIFMCS